MWEHVHLPRMQSVGPSTLLSSYTDTFYCRRPHGPEIAAMSGEQFPDKCESCHNHAGGLTLPSPCSTKHSSNTSNSSPYHPLARQGRSHTHEQHSSAGMSTFDHFNAVAALLPSPPPGGPNFEPGTLDPTNVAVYHHQKAIGLVQLPPLNCCSGRCRCPSGMCGCGTDCGGSCGQRGSCPGNDKGNNRENTHIIAEGAGKKMGQTVGYSASKRHL